MQHAHTRTKEDEKHHVVTPIPFDDKLRRLLSSGLIGVRSCDKRAVCEHYCGRVEPFRGKHEGISGGSMLFVQLFQRAGRLEHTPCNVMVSAIL